MTADGEDDGTGHFHRDGMPDYFEAMRAGGNALDWHVEDQVVQFRLVNNQIWMAVSPDGPVLKLPLSSAEALGTTLLGFHETALGWREK